MLVNEIKEALFKNPNHECRDEWIKELNSVISGYRLLSLKCSDSQKGLKKFCDKEANSLETYVKSLSVAQGG